MHDTDAIDASAASVTMPTYSAKSALIVAAALSGLVMAMSLIALSVFAKAAPMNMFWNASGLDPVPQQFRYLMFPGTPAPACAGPSGDVVELNRAILETWRTYERPYSTVLLPNQSECIVLKDQLRYVVDEPDRQQLLDSLRAAYLAMPETGIRGITAEFEPGAQPGEAAEVVLGILGPNGREEFQYRVTDKNGPESLIPISWRAESPANKLAMYIRWMLHLAVSSAAGLVVGVTSWYLWRRVSAATTMPGH